MVYCVGKLKENFELFYKNNRPHFLWVYPVNPLESVVYCLMKLAARHAYSSRR